MAQEHNAIFTQDAVQTVTINHQIKALSLQHPRLAQIGMYISDGRAYLFFYRPIKRNL
jgi:hypothetical protein